MTYIFHRFRARVRQPPPCFRKQVVDHYIDQTSAGFVKQAASLQIGISGADLGDDRAQDRHIRQVLDREQPRAKTVIHIVRVIGDIVGQSGDLRFVISAIKITSDLERIGDEAEKIGRMAMYLAGKDRPPSAFRQINQLGGHVRQMVRDSHPDRMQARGVPEEAVRLAERRLKDINRAWEEIEARQAA